MEDKTYTEPTKEEIQAYLTEHKLDRARNWWHAREALRRQKNGNPPNGHTDLGLYWKSI
jgi:hypothetical protein